MTDIALEVGFIGLGDQGLPMAAAIADAGFPLHVWARRTTSLAALGGTPHTAQGTLAELAAACDVIGLCVSADDDVAELLAELVPHLRRGAVVVNHGTGSPESARAWAEKYADAGVRVIDAPVSGARAGAEARTLLTCVGGDPTAAARCDPVFMAFSAHVLQLGPAGSGQLAKLVNNTLLMMNRANASDIVDLLGQGGIDPIPLVEAVKRGSGSSTALRLLPTGVGGEVLGAAAHLREVELMDMRLFADAMEMLGLDAEAITARAIDGAQRLAGLLDTLNPQVSP